jgi:hypothetical protein
LYGLHRRHLLRQAHAIVAQHRRQVHLLRPPHKPIRFVFLAPKVNLPQCVKIGRFFAFISLCFSHRKLKTNTEEAQRTRGEATAVESIFAQPR